MQKNRLDLEVEILYEAEVEILYEALKKARLLLAGGWVNGYWIGLSPALKAEMMARHANFVPYGCVDIPEHPSTLRQREYDDWRDALDYAGPHAPISVLRALLKVAPTSAPTDELALLKNTIDARQDRA